MRVIDGSEWLTRSLRKDWVSTMRTTVQAVSVLVIHPTIKTPDICAICAMWQDMAGNTIIRPAEYFGQWEDQNGPDHYIGICASCATSGFQGVIGTIEEFKAAQLRATGKAEYEIYGNTNAQGGTQYECASRPDACARIRVMIAHGVSIRAVYQRSVTNGRLRKLNQDEQARIVVEAMEG